MQNQIIIKNDKLIVTIALKGAEVRSVKNSISGHEYMWNGNPDVWTGVSPVLFPIVGKLVNNQFTHNEKSYNLTNHGFARQSIFDIVSQTENSVTLALDNRDLVENQVYPFHFHFKVTYIISDAKLTTTYEVINQGNKTAYFSVGAHPAFKCPFDNSRQISDYVIKFEQKEDLIQHEITSEAIFTGNSVTQEIQELQLNENIFDYGALIYSAYKSNYVSLIEKSTGRSVRISIDKFPFLGFWTMPGTSIQYVCIEPWCGHGDLIGNNGKIAEKAAIIKLEPKNQWRNTYCIKYLY